MASSYSASSLAVLGVRRSSESRDESEETDQVPLRWREVEDASMPAVMPKQVKLAVVTFFIICWSCAHLPALLCNVVVAVCVLSPPGLPVPLAECVL